MFSLAVQYNPTAGRYYENRSKAFRKLLNFEGARQDFICMLILDPTNEEVRASSHREDVGLLLTFMQLRCDSAQSGFPLISLSENNELIFVNCVCVFEQLPPMLMNLFPGCSVSDVLSSPTGQDIRVQLMDIIQAYSSFSEQQRSATQNPTGRLRHKSAKKTGSKECS